MTHVQSALLQRQISFRTDKISLGFRSLELLSCGFPQLASLTELVDLSVSGCIAVRDCDLALFGQRLLRLRSFSCSYCERVTSGCVPAGSWRSGCQDLRQSCHHVFCRQVISVLPCCHVVGSIVTLMPCCVPQGRHRSQSAAQPVPHQHRRMQRRAGSGGIRLP